MKQLIVGPLDTPQDVQIAIRSLFEAAIELQDLLHTTGIAAESLMPNAVVYVTSAGKWRNASASSSTTAPVTGYGVARAFAGVDKTLKIQVAGVIDGLSGLEVGRTYYLSPAGTFTLDTAGPIVIALGIAVSTTSLLFQPEYIGDT